MPAQVNVMGTLKQQNVACFEKNGGGDIIGLKTLEGTSVLVTNQVFADVPAMLAATPAAGTVCFLAASAFAGAGSPVAPVPVIYTGTRWAPFNNRQQLFKAQFETIAAPSMTVTGAPAAFSLSAYPTIPAGLLAVGDTLKFEYRVRRHGVAAMSHALYFGSHATYNSNVAPIGPQVGSVTDVTGHDYAAELTITSATSGVSTRNLVVNSGTGSTAMVDLSTNLNIAADQKAYPAITVLSGTDSVDLLHLEIIWIAGKLI
jgi:hypothetical protein